MQDFFNLINLFLEKKISYDSFNLAWIDMYIENKLSDKFNEDVQDIFEEIHEKIEYTVENPDEESRNYGYINHRELRDFISKKLTEIDKV